MTTPLTLERIVITDASGWHAGYQAVIDEDSQSTPGDVIQGTFKFIKQRRLSSKTQYMCVFYNQYNDPMWSYWGTLERIAYKASKFFRHPITFTL